MPPPSLRSETPSARTLCKAWRSNFRNMLGRSSLLAKAATRALTRSVSFQPGATLEAQIIRFEGLDGEQHFGTMVGDGTQARLLERAASGKMLPSDTIVLIHRILPPIDPIAVYGVGLNYRDHAAETGKEVPQLPSESAPLAAPLLCSRAQSPCCPSPSHQFCS